MIRTRLALAGLLCAAMATPAAAQYNNKDKRDPNRRKIQAKAPFRADAWGPKQGRPGTRCWVDGTGFKRNMTVLVGGRAVRIAKYAPQRIEFDFPRAGYGNAQIILRKPNYSDIIVGTFKVMPDPAIRRFGPRSGVAGTRVEIRGIGFAPGTQVMINGRALRADEINPRRIVFRIPAWAKTDYITLAGDGYKIRTRRQFQVLSPAPIIRGVRPAFGGPGTTVRINGDHFDGREKVFYGRRQLRQVRHGSGWVEFTVPGWARRSQPLRIRNQYGESTWNGPFGLRLPPVVRGYSPAYGSPGSQITITGGGFANGDYVTLGGARLPIISIGRNAIIVKVHPRARSGRIVVHRGGVAIPARGTYDVLNAPVIRSWSPKFGKYGTVVTLRGDGFGPRAKVFYGNRLVRPRRAGPGFFEVVVPNGAGAKRWRILGRGGEVWTGKPFGLRVYPAVRGISPAYGGPGTEIRVTGQRLRQAGTWYIGQTPLQVVRITPREVILKIPRNARSGKIWWDTHGERLGGTYAFDVLNAPVIRSWSPKFGKYGTVVTLRGDGFGPRAQVFYGTQRVRPRRVGPGLVEVVVPNGAGAKRWRIVGRGGEVWTGKPFGVRVYPVVRGISPAYGGPGTEIRVTGRRLRQAGTWYIGQVPLRVVRITPREVILKIPRNARSGKLWFDAHGERLGGVYAFDVLNAPVIRSWGPKFGKWGTVVTLRGEGFGRRAQIFYGTLKVRPRRSGRGFAEVVVPQGHGPKRWRIVGRGGEVWTGKPFGLRTYPAMTGLNPRYGGPGTEVRIAGRFLRQAGNWYIGKAPLQVVRQTPREVIVRIPANARSGKIWYDAHGERLGGGYGFDVRYGPLVSAFDPAYGPPGSLVTIRGQHFGGRRARVTWGPRKRLRVVKAGPGFITVQVPPRARGERYLWVEHNGQKVRTPNKFRIMLPPRISGLGPRRATYGNTLTIRGEGYGRNPIVKVGQRPARIVSRGPGQLVVEIPANVAPGRRWVWVTADGSTAKSPYPIDIRAPAIIRRVGGNRLYPGKTFIIDGEGFGPKIRVRVNGRWWPIKRRDRRGRRLWVEVPNNIPRGSYWVEAVKASGYAARSPTQIQILPRGNIRDKRRRR